MAPTRKRICMLALLAPSPAASGEGDFIDMAWIVFVAYCAIVILPHGVRAAWFLWKEIRAARQAKQTTADT